MMIVRKISFVVTVLALLASSAVAGVVDKKAALGGFDGFIIMDVPALNRG